MESYQFKTIRQNYRKKRFWNIKITRTIHKQISVPYRENARKVRLSKYFASIRSFFYGSLFFQDNCFGQVAKVMNFISMHTLSQNKSTCHSKTPTTIKNVCEKIRILLVWPHSCLIINNSGYDIKIISRLFIIITLTPINMDLMGFF